MVCSGDSGNTGLGLALVSQASQMERAGVSLSDRTLSLGQAGTCWPGWGAVLHTGLTLEIWAETCPLLALGEGQQAGRPVSPHSGVFQVPFRTPCPAPRLCSLRNAGLFPWNQRMLLPESSILHFVF